MRASEIRLVRYVAAGLLAMTLSLGVAATASAQDEHSGGNPPPNGPNDPNARVLGETLRQPQGSLPLTGGDLLGITAIGLGAVAVGTTVVVGSRRRAANAPA